MYCPQCGTPGQQYRFCAMCGASLQEQSAPVHRREVNVTVNVAGPTIVPLTPPPSPISQARSKLAQSALQAYKESNLKREQLRILWDAVQRHATQCDLLIADIESTVALELLPAGSPIRQRYRLALETRKQALEQCRDAVTVEDVMAVNDELRLALQDLAQTQIHLDSRSAVVDRY